jgi:hypothetical protein
MTHQATDAREQSLRWVRTPMPRLTRQVLQIIGGQTINGVDAIEYVADDPTLSAFYDPDVDTVYPSGLGTAWLMDDAGRQARRVLVRHDFAGATAPMIGGWVYLTRGTRVLTVSSGPDAGRTMTTYLVTWAI